MCAAAADIDGDGLDELAVCTSQRGSFLYRNDGGTLVEDTASFGLDDHGRRTMEFADVNGDDRPDLATVVGERVDIYLNSNGRFVSPDGGFAGSGFSVRAQHPNDVAFGDVDGDGDLDLYLQMGVASSDPDRVYLNDGDGRFTAGPEMPATDGGGDPVVTFPDWDHSGRDAFIVNNGFEESAGPRQLLHLTGG